MIYLKVKLYVFLHLLQLLIDPDAFEFPVVKTHKLTSYSKNFPSDKEKTLKR